MVKLTFCSLALTGCYIKAICCVLTESSLFELPASPCCFLCTENVTPKMNKILLVSSLYVTGRKYWIEQQGFFSGHEMVNSWRRVKPPTVVKEQYSDVIGLAVRLSCRLADDWYVYILFRCEYRRLAGTVHRKLCICFRFDINSIKKIM